jgi:signal transduction histidine kinase
VRITVADTGSGIDPALKSKIWEPFFTTKKDIGTGLGLWVSKQIMEKHAGSIRFRSSSKGTVFVLFLPATTVVQSRGVSAGWKAQT